MNLLSTSDIDKAHLILQPFITQTPLVTNEALNTLVNAKVYFKLENLQKMRLTVTVQINKSTQV